MVLERLYVQVLIYAMMTIIVSRAFVFAYPPRSNIYLLIGVVLVSEGICAGVPQVWQHLLLSSCC